jgi:hypothetical protein
MFPERQPMRSGDLRPEFFDVVEPCGATLPLFCQAHCPVVGEAKSYYRREPGGLTTTRIREIGVPAPNWREYPPPDSYGLESSSSTLADMLPRSRTR